MVTLDLNSRTTERSSSYVLATESRFDQFFSRVGSFAITKPRSPPKLVGGDVRSGKHLGAESGVSGQGSYVERIASHFVLLRPIDGRHSRRPPRSQRRDWGARSSRSSSHFRAFDSHVPAPRNLRHWPHDYGTTYPASLLPPEKNCIGPPHCHHLCSRSVRFEDASFNKHVR